MAQLESAQRLLASLSRRGALSCAYTRPVGPTASARKMVLPPAPAQKSTTVWPGAARQRPARSWLPRSITCSRPSFIHRLSKTARLSSTTRMASGASAQGAT